MPVCRPFRSLRGLAVDAGDLFSLYCYSTEMERLAIALCSRRCATSRSSLERALRCARKAQRPGRPAAIAGVAAVPRRSAGVTLSAAELFALALGEAGIGLDRREVRRRAAATGIDDKPARRRHHVARTQRRIVLRGDMRQARPRCGRCSCSWRSFACGRDRRWADRHSGCRSAPRHSRCCCRNRAASRRPGRTNGRRRRRSSRHGRAPESNCRRRCARRRHGAGRPVRAR